MLTVKEVAARLRVGEVTILRWLRSGKLAGVKYGGTRIGWRIPLAEVERIERGEPVPAARPTAASALRRDAERLGFDTIASGIRE